MASVHLFVRTGPASGAAHPLAGSLTIGRGTGADLMLPDEAVSRAHATLRVDGQTVVVEDLDSSNGTYVNGEPIDGAVRLEHGDVVRLGGSELEIRVGSDEKSHATPTEDTVIQPGPG